MNRVLVAAGLAGVLIAAVVPGVAASASGQPFADVTYSSPTVVGMSRGEPRMAVAPDGTLYVAASQPLGRDSVFTSADDGDTWSALPGTNIPFGGGDDDVMVSSDGTVWLAGQEPGSLCESVASSVGGGAAFVPQPIACGVLGSADRPWLAASDRGPQGLRVFLYFNLNGTHTITASDDGGLTWSTVGTLPGGHFPGYLVVDGTAGFVYAVTTIRTGGHDASLVVYRSADEGATWTPYPVAPMTTGDRGLSHVYLAADDAGNLYTAWADDPDGSGMRVWFARSTDHAATWSPPVLVSSAAGTHVFPAIDAGTPGRVAVAWYETPTTGDPNTLDDAAQWHVEGATSIDGGVHWTTAAVSSVNHTGALCTKGGSCSGHRLLLDFLSVVVDGDGAAHVVWSDDTAPGIDLLVGPVVTSTARSTAVEGIGARPFDTD